MPKFITPLAQIKPSDASEIGRNFASLGSLNDAGARLPRGFVINFSGFQEIIEPHQQEINEVLKFITHTGKKEEFIQSLRKLVLPRITFPEKLSAEISGQLRNLKFPLTIQTTASIETTKEYLSPEKIVEKRSLFWEDLKEIYFDFLSAQVLAKQNLINLEKIDVAASIIEKVHPEVSGKAVILSPKSNLIKITAFWGEPKEVGDHITVTRSSLEIQHYIPIVQETQVVWSNGALQELKIAPKFQSIAKLKPEFVKEISTLLRKLQHQTLSALQTSFVIYQEKLYFTEVSQYEENFNSVHIDITIPTLAELKPLFPRVAKGMVRYLNNYSDIKRLRRGEIAVVNSFKKEHLKFLRKASGVIINKTDSLHNSHRQLLRDLGISMAIGDLDKHLEGLVTLDGRTGKVHKGPYFPLLSKNLKEDTAPITNDKRN